MATGPCKVSGSANAKSRCSASGCGPIAAGRLWLASGGADICAVKVCGRADVSDECVARRGFAPYNSRGPAQVAADDFKRKSVVATT